MASAGTMTVGISDPDGVLDAIATLEHIRADADYRIAALRRGLVVTRELVAVRRDTGGVLLDGTTNHALPVASTAPTPIPRPLPMVDIDRLARAIEAVGMSTLDHEVRQIVAGDDADALARLVAVEYDLQHGSADGSLGSAP